MLKVLQRHAHYSMVAIAEQITQMFFYEANYLSVNTQTHNHKWRKRSLLAFGYARHTESERKVHLAALTTALPFLHH